jgi:ferric-dicitrate binding protein FerR (iron transport regulator)
MDKELLYRYFDGKTSAEEEMLIMNWAESSQENYDIYLQARKIWLASLVYTPQYDARKPIRRGIRYMPILGRVAAGIFLLISCVFFLNYLMNNSFFDSTMQRVDVPAGQRVELTLTDGTKVWLNSNSSIEYPSSFGWRMRKVILSGEGYFEVTHNERRPFVVCTSNYDIQVLGTTFNVYAYDNQFETALLYGSVKISSHNREDCLVLKPSEMATVGANGKLQRIALTDMNHFRWTEGLVCLDDMPFSELLEKFSDYFGIRILLKNPELSSIRCTGKFRQSDGIDYSLRVLQRLVKFQYRHDVENHLIEIY